MMLEIKLAKSMMENEEGMNHLWIQVLRNEEVVSQKLVIQIQLPNGVYRSRNLNGYFENKREHIVIDPLDQDVIVEIFTQDAIECGELTIEVTLTACEITISKKIPIQVVEEDEMDRAEMDEQVLERIKRLRNANVPSNNVETTAAFNQPKVLEIRDNPFSYLEKKYRMDY